MKTEPDAAVGQGGKGWRNQVLGEFDFKFHGEWLNFSVFIRCGYATITPSSHKSGVSMRGVDIPRDRSWARSGAH
jgi:hypothetical protein